ncbi:MAG: hypothetical protein AAFP90_20240, partial [Planctomycetota bacterium]
MAGSGSALPPPNGFIAANDAKGLRLAPFCVLAQPVSRTVASETAATAVAENFRLMFVAFATILSIRSRRRDAEMLTGRRVSRGPCAFRNQ